MAKSSMMEQLKNRMQASNKRASAFGEGGGSLRATGDAKFFNPDAGNDYILDIIPYIAGENGPLDPEENFTKEKNPAGEWAYVMEFWEHRNLGADAMSKILCLAKNFNKPCPVCEHRTRLIADGGDEKLIKDLKPSLRCAYNVIVYDGGKLEKASPMVWAVSHFYSEENFQSLAKKRRRGDTSADPYIYFMDKGKDGKSISFEQLGKKDMFKLGGLKFEDRDYSLDDELLENTHCLEEFLKIPEYEDVYKFYWGEDTGAVEKPRSRDDNEPETEPAPRSRRTKTAPAPEPEPETEPAPRSRRTKTAPTPEPEPETEPAPRSRRTRTAPEPEPAGDEPDFEKLKAVDWEPLNKKEMISELEDAGVDIEGDPVLAAIFDEPDDNEVYFIITGWLEDNDIPF